MPTAASKRTENNHDWRGDVEARNPVRLISKRQPLERRDPPPEVPGPDPRRPDANADDNDQNQHPQTKLDRGCSHVYFSVFQKGLLPVYSRNARGRAISGCEL